MPGANEEVPADAPNAPLPYAVAVLGLNGVMPALRLNGGRLEACDA